MIRKTQELKLIQDRIDREEYLETLKKGFIFADTFINRPYLDHFTKADFLPVSEDIRNVSSDIRIFQVEKVVFDKSEDISDKLMNVYNALYNLSITTAIIIKGDVNGAKFYFATRSPNALLAESILSSSLRGNFPGIDIKNLESSDILKLQNDLMTPTEGVSMLKSLATVSMIPALRNKEKKDQFVQGLEKFLNALNGKSYTAILLAVPVTKEDISIQRHGYEELFSTLSPHAKISYAYGENLSNAVNKGISYSFTKSMNESVSNSNSRSSSNTEGSGYSSSDGSSYNWQGWGSNSGSSSSSSSSYTSGESFSHSISNSVGKSEGETENQGETVTEGTSKTRTLNYENKGISNLMKRIEEQFKRLDLSESYGLWEYCAYFFSNDISTAIMAATTYKSLMTGENTYVENTHVNTWNVARNQGEQIKTIMNHVRNLIHPLSKLKIYEEYLSLNISPTSLVNGSELAILLGMPRKSVSGVIVQEMAEFGRDVFYENELPQKTISVGNVYYMGIEEKNRPVNLNLKLLSSHCFITGSSGSGKSYLTYNLLDRLISQGIKLLVIEPAKGEYKMIFGKLHDINIFTTEINSYRLLRINPFQFPDQINILAHIESLLQIFNASWTLYAAMPAILKDAVVSSYVKCGWDIKNSIWIEGISDKKYPTFEDVLEILPQIINSSDYSADSKGDYKGALLTRVNAMTTGLNGLIFKGSSNVTDANLFDENTIIDLSEVGSDETIALIMGFLIMRLGEYRKSKRKSGSLQGHDNELSHITVLEEAHNLLKRTSKEQSQEGANMVGKSVEMISNSIKEMRTYGEGFLIIDQSPLAVDSSVIENTSTKIIMNTPSKEACEELGSALSLNENQTRELSRLNVGVAAVMQKGWLMPVLMRVGTWDSNKYEAELVTENKDLIIATRSKLIVELVRQNKEKKYSIDTFRKIINDSKLSNDRKKELFEIVDLYRTLKTHKGISQENLGILFMEIASCENLFEIVPQKGLCSQNEFGKNFDIIAEEEQEKEYEKMLESFRTWFSKLEQALEQYIWVEPDILRYTLIHMIAMKGNSGYNENNVFGSAYRLLSEGILINEEVK